MSMFEINPSNARQWTRIGSRGVFGQAVLAVAEHHPDMMVISADLGNSSGLDRFKKTYPEQFLNIGIAEQNMIGVAAGMAKEGYNVFATSFAPFITMRSAEQVRMNMGYMGTCVSGKVVSTESGTGAALSLATTLRTCWALRAPDSTTRSTATRTASKPAAGTAANTCAMTLSPPSWRIKPWRSRCSGPGRSANGAPLRKAPGLRCTSAM